VFVVEVTYIKPIQEIDRFLVPHRDYLELHYQKKNLLASGPQNPRTAGLILTRFRTRAEVEHFITGDPFHQEGLATYRIIDFDPVKSDPQFKALLA